MHMRAVHVDPVGRFSLEVDDDTGLTYLGIPVRNSMVEYTEWYRVDRELFTAFVVDPSSARPMVERARRREIDHLLLLPPGRDRGVADPN